MNVWSQGLVVLGLAVIAGPRVSAADEPASSAQPDAVCVGCHGPGGNKPVMPQTRSGADRSQQLLACVLRERSRYRVKQAPILFLSIDVD